MNLVHAVISTPLGAIRLVASRAALVGVYLPGQRTDDTVVITGHAAEHAILRETARQLLEYFAGTRRAFALPVLADGTTFQRAVWSELASIPFGATRSYGELARAIGSPRASRAVGSANARNPISIVVPCHRVVGSAGALTGYAGGLPAKRWLLAHEARVADRPSWHERCDASAQALLAG